MQCKRLLPVMAALALLILVVAACGGETTPCPTAEACPPAATCEACPTCPEAAACPTTEACPAPEACPTCPEAGAGVTTTAVACPYQDEWAGSPHADAEAEAFNHWNEDDPKETPTGCANCHSSTGFMDYVGADGSAVGVVDKAAPVGEVITCNACHNDAAAAFDVIPFPSGITVTVEGPENRCLVCHQGRASGAMVDKKIADSGVPDDDTVSPKITFSNVHYKAAAATMYGTVVKGGYEYTGKAYDVKFEHEPGIDTCVDCHDQHTLELKVEGCFCHNLKTAEDARNVREAGSLEDYDGDGNIEEGIYYEVQGLQETLLKAIQMYASEVSTQAIAYNPDAYPYWFGDDNANGTADEGEAGYKGWTGRLSKAAYNYQFSLKDTGAYAHNGKYIIQLLYDSTEDLNTKLATPIDMEAMNREDAGHFRASSEAFRHWDEEPAVEGGCVKCHQAEGVPQFIENGANVAMPQSSSLQCATCHGGGPWPARYEVTEVKMPSGKTVAYDNPDSNLCIECHQGRTSKATVDKAVADKEPDTVMENQRFINSHYLGIAAVWFGADAQGFYEYDGKTYLGTNAHVPVNGKSGCVGCHDVHTGAPQEDACKTCHGDVAVDDIRMPSSAADYNGNGDVTEGIRQEYRLLRDALYAEIQAYANNTVGTGITYNTDAYPYWFVDADGDDVADEKDGAAVAYTTWTPRLLKAAYNFNFFRKNPGAGAHNGKYAIQVIYDSIEDLGGDVTKYARP
jgi:hypothetical protein